mmetsp:Transcript_29411/g.94281  ORF Transcript_29411/g.94281 Transcript_29411/m.94281 type:complete len:83 (-) Transcript_29411:64-312(-)
MFCIATASFGAVLPFGLMYNPLRALAIAAPHSAPALSALFMAYGLLGAVTVAFFSGKCSRRLGRGAPSVGSEVYSEKPEYSV